MEPGVTGAMSQCNGARGQAKVEHDQCRGLVDRFGRTATDLRVSLTDRCNLRCTYCMPEEGLAWLPKQTLLTDDEIVRLVGIAVRRLGRHRGPVHRRRAAAAPGAGATSSAAAARLTPRPQLSLTTNGIGLARIAAGARGGRAGPGERLARHRCDRTGSRR